MIVQAIKDFFGSLGKNDRKTKDTHPDYSGSCVIGGKPYWISGWVKESSRGKFISLSFKPKDEVKRVVATDAAVDFDDSLPF